MVMLSGGIVGADDEAGGTLDARQRPRSGEVGAPGYANQAQDAVGALRRSADCGCSGRACGDDGERKPVQLRLVFDPLECGDEPMVHQRNIEVCVGVPHLFMAG